MGKIIILEGSQGSGKTTLTNSLREHIPYSQLVRLSGLQGLSESTRDRTFSFYYNMFNFLYKSKDLDITFIFDRFVFSEYVYCLLGYKEYSFDEEFRFFMRKLDDLASYYDIHIFLLHTTSDILETRLSRDKALFNDIQFSISNSLSQQSAYEDVFESFIDTSRINYSLLDTSDSPSNIVETLLSTLFT